MSIRVDVMRAKTADELAEKINSDKEERFASQIHVEPLTGDMVVFIFRNVEGSNKKQLFEDGSMATEKQKYFMNANKIEIPENCTKLQASERIDKFKNG